MASLFGNLGNNITYTIAGVGLGTLVGAVGADAAKVDPTIGAVAGALGGGALGYIASNMTATSPTSKPTPGTFSVSNTNILIGSGLLGGATYTPSSVVVQGTGFSAATRIEIQDENGNTLATATTGISGNFDNLGIGGTGGPLKFSTYNPIAGTGYLVVYDPHTQLYSNKVSMTYVNRATAQGGGTPGTGSGGTSGMATPIISISPTSVSGNGQPIFVTLTGKGFGNENNTVSLSGYYNANPNNAIVVGYDYPIGINLNGDLYNKKTGSTNITIQLPIVTGATLYTIQGTVIQTGNRTNTINISVTSPASTGSSSTGSSGNHLTYPAYDVTPNAALFPVTGAYVYWPGFPNSGHSTPATAIFIPNYLALMVQNSIITGT